jgi:hypothetical protein
MNKPIYTIDAETDPFLFGRLPKPFAIGLYDGERYRYAAGANCVDVMYDTIYNLPPGIIYAHNGGRFDFFLFMHWFVNNPMRIINSRIIKAKMECRTGWHELRDSYAIMPFPLKKALGKARKLDIDITKLEAAVRHLHMPEILTYLKQDCVALWELVTDFISEFGSMLTIGSTAMKELKKVHSFENLEQADDADLRSHYYYGGRVQALKKGVLEGSWKVYDVNSMYPNVMKNATHPIGRPSSEGTTIHNSTCFITAVGVNHGAFPQRVKGGGIDFTIPYGVFYVTRHEWDVAMELGLFEPEKIVRCINFESRITFAEFVDKFYQMRIDANLRGDSNLGLFYKYILNSSYGKFSQNPDNYKEFVITDTHVDMHSQGYIPEEIKYGTYIVWSKPSRDNSRYNVAVGASITGASRAALLRGLSGSTNPIYCDTDSIICESIGLVKQHATELGAWKLEAEADVACIAGKKMYALFLNGETIKQANKGVKVTAADIRKVAEGETISTKRDAPSFKLNGSHLFIQRRLRMT